MIDSEKVENFIKIIAQVVDKDIKIKFKGVGSSDTR